MEDTLVAGEPAKLLLEALTTYAAGPPDSAPLGEPWRLERRIGDPLGRALLRVQSELCLYDAERIGSPGYVDRTNEQRFEDTFRLLAERVIDAACD